MSQQSHVSGFFSPADPPLKRKRGRPRKDDNQLQEEKSPVMTGSDSVKKNKQMLGASNAAVDDMVGKVVSGVIEGSFDAGYLLNVKVGDADTQLRGVVFLPGRFTPITAENDVAPNAKMYNREEIPIPVHIINKQVTESKVDAPKFSDQIPPPEIQSRVPTAGENLPDSAMKPLADKLPMDDTGPQLGEKFILQQKLDPGIKNRTATIMAQLKHDKIIEQDQVQQDTIMDVEASKELEPASLPSEPVPTPIIDLMPSSENVYQEPQVRGQPLNSELKPSDCVHAEVKSQNFEDHQTSVLTKPVTRLSEADGVGLLMVTPNFDQNPFSAEPRSISTQSLGTDINMKKVNSLMEYRPEDALLDLANKTIADDESSFPIRKAANISSGGYTSSLPFGEAVNITARGYDTSLSVGSASNYTAGGYDTSQFGKAANNTAAVRLFEASNITAAGFGTSLPVRESANITSEGSYSAPMANLSVMMFGGEAISTEHKLGTEEPVLPKKIDTQVCSSSTATNDLDPDLKAAMTHTSLDLSSGLNLSGLG